MRARGIREEQQRLELDALAQKADGLLHWGVLLSKSDGVIG
jgi:hypothetical protein